MYKPFNRIVCSLVLTMAGLAPVAAAHATSDKHLFGNREAPARLAALIDSAPPHAAGG